MKSQLLYISTLFDIISPRRCLLCSQFLTHPLASVPAKGTMANYLCLSCSRQLEVCDSSFVPDHLSAIDQVFSGYHYAGAAARIIPAWKYHHRNEFFPLITLLMQLTLSRLRLSESNLDLVVAVPLFRKALARRNFNQALFLASCSAKELNLPLSHQLVKSVNTPQQASLDRRERAANLDIGTFAVPDPESVKGRNILLCDDVLTTGATLNTVASVLKRAGAVSVTALTLARVGL